MKDELFLEIYAPLCVPVMYGKPTNSHVVVGVVRKIKLARNWLGRFRMFFFSTTRWCSRKRFANLLSVLPM